MQPSCAKIFCKTIFVILEVQFHHEGLHWETRYFLTFFCKWPNLENAKNFDLLRPPPLVFGIKNHQICTKKWNCQTKSLLTPFCSEDKFFPSLFFDDFPKFLVVFILSHQVWWAFLAVPARNHPNDLRPCCHVPNTWSAIALLQCGSGRNYWGRRGCPSWGIWLEVQVRVVQVHPSCTYRPVYDWICDCNGIS